MSEHDDTARRPRSGAIVAVAMVGFSSWAALDAVPDLRGYRAVGVGIGGGLLITSAGLGIYQQLSSARGQAPSRTTMIALGFIAAGTAWETASAATASVGLRCVGLLLGCALLALSTLVAIRGAIRGGRRRPAPTA